jgi:hypothetical protein
VGKYAMCSTQRCSQLHACSSFRGSGADELYHFRLFEKSNTQNIEIIKELQ